VIVQGQSAADKDGGHKERVVRAVFVGQCLECTPRGPTRASFLPAHPQVRFWRAEYTLSK